MKKLNVIIWITAICFSYSAQNLYPAFKKTREIETNGFIDKTGKVVVPLTKYSETFNFSEGLGIVYDLYKGYAYVNSSGEIISPYYELAYPFKNNYALVRKGADKYFIDKDFKEYELEMKLNKDEVSEGLYQIDINYKIGFANLQNEIIIPPIYEKASLFYDGVAIVEKEKNKWYALTLKGKEIEIKDVISATHFSNGLLAVQGKNKMWGFMNEDFELVIDYKFKQVKDFSDGFAVFNENGYYGLIDKRGEIVLNATNKEIDGFQEERCIVINEKQELILLDRDLKEIKRIKFIEAGVSDNYKFENGLCLIHQYLPPDPKSKDMDIRKYGGVVSSYIDKTGKTIWTSSAWYSCFPGNAIITMADFSQKQIDVIEQGDLILYYNPETKEFEPNLVKEIEVHEGSFETNRFYYNSISEITASLSWINPTINFLESTPNHPILTSNGIKSMKNIEENDFIFVFNTTTNKQSLVKVLNKEITKNTSKVYNLKTEKENYLVNGVVVLRK